MQLRHNWLLPLVALVGIQPTLSSVMSTEGCGDTTPTPTPNPEPTPEPATGDKATFDQYLLDLKATSDKATRDQLTSTFFRKIEYSGGFPIIDGNTITFVHQASASNEPIRVSGDFNAWSATANVMTRPVSDYDLYYTTITVSNPRTRLMYKYINKTSGQDVYYADPVSRRFQYDSYGQYSLVFGGSQSEKSHLERLPQFQSDYVGYDRDLWLYMPPGYDQEPDTYPVVYMHDGQNLFDPNAFYGGWKVDQVIDSLLAQNKLQEMVVVGIANSPDRMDEYTHVEDFLPAYGGYLGGTADLYALSIVSEVKPFIDSHYRTRPGRESTAMLGSSLGGVISYYVGWQYSDLFKYVGGMSSTFGWGSLNLHNPTMIENLQSTAKLPVIWYLDSGGDDGGGCKDSDNDGVYDDSANSDDNYCETWQMYNVLKAKGYATSELKYITSPGQEHNEASWNTRVDDVLLFWFPKL